MRSELYKGIRKGLEVDMSDWKEAQIEKPEEPATGADKGVENEQNKGILEEGNHLREKERSELQEDIRKEELERSVRQSPTMKSAVQGYSPEDYGSENLPAVSDEDNGVDDPSAEIDEREKGIAPLSDETKMELERIKNLPVEQRQQAMGDFFQNQQDVLGNLRSEGMNMQLDAKVHPGGKGVTITDKDGIKYVIDYEE
jgi:hypothetical protein